MKQLLLSCMVVACLLSACNNNKKTADATAEDATAAKVEVNPVVEELKKKTGDLEKLTPLTADELKNLLPESIMGAKKSDVESGPTSGILSASAEYDINDTTEVEVTIYDCGGPSGSGFFTAQYIPKFMNMQAGAEGEYTKAIDFKGEKAVEECHDNLQKCKLTYLSGNRFMVVLAGKNVHPDGLKQAANELRIM